MLKLVNKRLATCAFLLVLPAIIDARRIKADSDGWGVSRTSNSTAVAIASGNDGANITEIANVIGTVFKKTIQAVGVIAQWSSVKLALNESRAAAEQASQALDVLKHKLVNTSVMFVSSGLKGFCRSVNNGLANVSILQSMFQSHEDGAGTADFYEAVESFRSISIELMEIVTSSETVMKVIKGVRELTDKVSEFTDALISVDMSIFDVLTETAKFVVQQLKDLVQTIEKYAKSIKAMLDDFASKAWEKVKAQQEKFQDMIKDTFGGLDEELETVNTIFVEQIEPLVPQIVEGVRKLTAAAQSFILPLDAPDHAAEEKMDRRSCSWRNTRWFRSLEDVDISKTMACEREWFGRYKCWCIGRYDCYASARPEPKKLRRCFRKEWMYFDPFS